MKVGFTVALLFSRFILVVFAVVVLVGCTRTLSFRVIDGSTGAAIADVRTSVDEERGNLLLPYLHEHRDIGMTSTQGVVIVDGVRTSEYWGASVLFQKAGYFEAGCVYAGRNPNSVAIFTRVPTSIQVTGQTFSTIETSGEKEITVRMFPADPSQLDLQLYDWIALPGHPRRPRPHITD